MPKSNNDLNKLSYQELEEKLKEILEILKDENLPVDDANKYYQQGKQLIDLMEKKLSELEKEVTNQIEE